MSTHPSMLTLRRLHSGEAAFGEVQAHLAGCAACAAKLQSFTAEQRELEQAVPFERFAAGVQKRTARPVRRAVTVGLALAATLALVFAVSRSSETAINRVKGGASVDMVVSGGGGQRQAAGEPEALAPGERVRVGLTAGVWRYAMVVSIDERGMVTPIYLENGRSLSVTGTAWLPDSLEFTGRGLERLVIVLSQAPLTLDTVSQAAKSAYDAAHGDVARMTDLELPGEQFQRTFLKP